MVVVVVVRSVMKMVVSGVGAKVWVVGGAVARWRRVVVLASPVVVVWGVREEARHAPHLSPPPPHPAVAVVVVLVVVVAAVPPCIKYGTSRR